MDTTSHSNRVFCVKYDQDDPNMIASGGWDCNVKIWDIRQGHPVRNIAGPYICGSSIDINNGYLVTGSYRDEKQIELWDYATGKSITDI